MDWFVRCFVKASLLWFGLGISLGALMAGEPAMNVYRLAHVHMNLLGFVTMMIFGVAYHVIPRFTGHPLYSRRLAGAHWWISNLGLVFLVTGFALAPHLGNGSRPLLATGGILSAAGGFTFIVNLWRTIDGPVRQDTTASRVSPVSSRRPAILDAG